MDENRVSLCRFVTSMFCFCVVVVGSASAAKPPITAVAFAPGGQSVVAVSQSGLHEFEWPDLRKKRTIEVKAPNLHCVVFSPNGKQIAIGGGSPAEDGLVEILSWPSGESLLTLRGHSDSVRGVVWRTDLELLSASRDRSIKLWQLENHREPLATFAGHSRSVDAICLLNDGATIVSAGVDRSVRVWNLQEKRLIRSSSQHIKPINSLALKPSAEGLPIVASAAGDRVIRFWQPTIGRMVRLLKIPSEPLDLAWLKGAGKMAAACVDGKVRIIDTDEVEILQTLPVLDGWAYAIATHPADGTLVVAGSNGQIKRVKAFVGTSE